MTCTLERARPYCSTSHNGRCIPTQKCKADRRSPELCSWPGGRAPRHALLRLCCSQSRPYRRCRPRPAVLRDTCRLIPKPFRSVVRAPHHGHTDGTPCMRAWPGPCSTGPGRRGSVTGGRTSHPAGPTAPRFLPTTDILRTFKSIGTAPMQGQLRLEWTQRQPWNRVGMDPHGGPSRATHQQRTPVVWEGVGFRRVLQGSMEDVSSFPR